MTTMYDGLDDEFQFLKLTLLCLGREQKLLNMDWSLLPASNAEIVSEKDILFQQMLKDLREI